MPRSRASESRGAVAGRRAEAGGADHASRSRPTIIICLEDGKKFKSLKRHLRTHYDLTPEQYREKWGLPRRLSDGRAELLRAPARAWPRTMASAARRSRTTPLPELPRSPSGGRFFASRSRNAAELRRSVNRGGNWRGLINRPKPSSPKQAGIRRIPCSQSSSSIPVGRRRR